MPEIHAAFWSDGYLCLYSKNQFHYETSDRSLIITVKMLFVFHEEQLFLLFRLRNLEALGSALARDISEFRTASAVAQSEE